MKTEIIDFKKDPEIDWDKPQLLINEHTNLIILSSGDHCSKEFDGTVINQTNSEGYDIGDFSKTWVKNVFKPFTGKIILSND